MRRTLLFLFLIIFLLGINLITGCGQGAKETGGGGGGKDPFYLTISPSNPTTEEGNSIQFKAILFYHDGSSNEVSATWIASTETGTINKNGLFTAIKPGTGTITAMYTSLFISTSIYITRNGIWHFELLDPHEDRTINEIFSVESIYQTSPPNQWHYTNNDLINWSIFSDKCTMISPGVFQALKPGVETIIGTYEGFTDCLNFNILPKYILTAEADAFTTFDLVGNIGLGAYLEGYCAMGYNTTFKRLYFSFIKFDTSMIPSSLIISQANLYLYISIEETDSYIGASFDIYENSCPWSEDTLTYYNQPPKGIFFKTFSFPNSGITEYQEFDLTDLVQQWISGSKNNYGLRFENPPVSGLNITQYISRRAELYVVPKLEIDFNP